MTTEEKREAFKNATKLHEIISMALSDADEMLCDDRNVLDMSSWLYQEAGECHFCLAGAIMASRLGATGIINAWPSDVVGARTQEYGKLYAIDNARAFHVAGALRDFRRAVANDWLMALSGSDREAAEAITLDLWKEAERLSIPLDETTFDRDQGHWRHLMNHMVALLRKADL